MKCYVVGHRGDWRGLYFGKKIALSAAKKLRNSKYAPLKGARVRRVHGGQKIGHFNPVWKKCD